MLEAIIEGFLPEIRENVVRDPCTLDELENAASLSETAGSHPALRTGKSTTYDSNAFKICYKRCKNSLKVKPTPCKQYKVNGDIWSKVKILNSLT